MVSAVIFQWTYMGTDGWGASLPPAHLLAADIIIRGTLNDIIRDIVQSVQERAAEAARAARVVNEAVMAGMVRVASPPHRSRQTEHHSLSGNSSHFFACDTKVLLLAASDNCDSL